MHDSVEQKPATPYDDVTDAVRALGTHSGVPRRTAAGLQRRTTAHSSFPTFELGVPTAF